MMPKGTYTFLPLEKVYFGAGSVERLPAEADRLHGTNALVITGETLSTKTDMVQRVERLLGPRHAGTFAGIRQHVPESGVASAAELAQERHVDFLVSLGGGSPIDAA